MHIICAETAGFCMGVRRAVQIAQKTAQRSAGGNIYTIGPLIHNPQVIERLRDGGIIAADGWETIESGIIIIRAHGMPKNAVEKMRDKKLEIVDATCPHVVASQKRIESHFLKEHGIIIAGDRDHPEIISLQSFAESGSTVVSGIAEAENTALPDIPSILIAQTTFNETEFSEIADILKRRLSCLIVYNSICEATSKRQREIKDLAARVDAVVVVGGKNSANTKRLSQIAQIGGNGKPVYHIETTSELSSRMFRGCSSVAVTAGASTPDWITQEVVKTLKNF